MSNNKVIQTSYQIPKTTKSLEYKALSNCVKSLGLAKIQPHIFICADQTIANCCSKRASLESWEYLKKRLQEFKLPKLQESHPICVFKTKANCLQVYCSRPIMVVYRDGVWYRQANPEVIEQLVQEHSIGNKVIEKYAFLTHPLPETSLVSCEHLIEA
ncbi:(2Fe-2S) ferredoxin domain-containing protein [Nostoc sp. PA-18-2419]|uniref:(2Fe-2S) ferredoxin domain-containing protein n=1 Tax=Nostoc sp. PA-18-2419 TaxID=2575443 RepID=UPI001CB9A3C4|nr:ferredoxin [Nostoc sp. PA-18-2419]